MDKIFGSFGFALPGLNFIKNRPNQVDYIDVSLYSIPYAYSNSVVKAAGGVTLFGGNLLYFTFVSNELR